MSKPYKATSLKSAERQVRQLRKLRDELFSLAEADRANLITILRLAAPFPAFSNPIHVAQAERLRDDLIKKYNIK